MKVDIWLDLASPWCAIGKKRFLKALEDFSGAQDLKIVWHAVELSPLYYSQETLKKEEESLEEEETDQERESFARLKAWGAEVGLDFSRPLGLPQKTREGHCLIKWAEKKEAGSGSRLFDRLNEAYFKGEISLEKTDSLLDVVEKMGFSRQEAAASLKDSSFQEAIQEDERALINLRPSGFPLFLFKEEWQISGAQEVKTFYFFLEKNFQEGSALWKQEQGSLALFWYFWKNLLGLGKRRT